MLSKSKQKRKTPPNPSVESGEPMRAKHIPVRYTHKNYIKEYAVQGFVCCFRSAPWLACPMCECVNCRPKRCSAPHRFPPSPHHQIKTAPTYYFRKRVTVNAVSTASLLGTVGMRCDDGAVLYINGVEVRPAPPTDPENIHHTQPHDTHTPSLGHHRLPSAANTSPVSIMGAGCL